MNTINGVLVVPGSQGIQRSSGTQAASSASVTRAKENASGIQIDRSQRDTVTDSLLGSPEPAVLAQIAALMFNSQANRDSKLAQGLMAMAAEKRSQDIRSFAA